MNKMTRRDFNRSMLAAGLGAGAMIAPAAADEPGPLDPGGRMNVLLFFTDDQSAHLACLGTRGIDTPVTDALAAAGVVFRNAFSTCASCSPARSGILTGMACHSNGHWRNTHGPHIPGQDIDYTRQGRIIDPVGVHEDIPTLIEVLNDWGYCTGVTSKFHLSPPWKYPFQERLAANADPQSHAVAARRFFEAAGARPFFLMANIGHTHRPWGPHLKPIESPGPDPDAIEIPPELPDTPTMREDFATYLHTVEAADQTAGVILDELRAAGLHENTLIVFTSDQGYCYHRAKATAYDDGVRVPMVISGPGVARGRRDERLVSHTDIMPTVLDLAGIPIPGTVQGRSLRPLLAGDDRAPWREYVFSEHNAHGPNPLEYYPCRGVHDGRYHYIRNLTPERTWDGELEDLLGGAPPEVMFAAPADALPGGPWGNRSFAAIVAARETHPEHYALLKSIFKRPPEELYDLEADPGEMHNLADEPAHAEKLAELRAAVDQWMRDTNDPGADLRNVPRRTASA